MFSAGLDKGFASKFWVGSRIRNKTPKEGPRTHRPKRCEYNKEDEDNCANTLSDTNFLASLRKSFIFKSFLCLSSRCIFASIFHKFPVESFFFFLVVVVNFILFFTMIILRQLIFHALKKRKSKH